MSRLTCGHIQHMYSWWWVELSPETCRVKPLRRINAIVASCWIYFTITSTSSPSYCKTIFSPESTKPAVLLPQSHYSTYCTNRYTGAPTAPTVQKHTDVRKPDFGRYHDSWYQLRLTNGTCAWSWRLYGINYAMLFTKLFRPASRCAQPASNRSECESVDSPPSG